jgi:folate/biopterin transporter
MTEPRRSLLTVLPLLLLQLWIGGPCCCTNALAFGSPTLRRFRSIHARQLLTTTRHCKPRQWQQLHHPAWWNARFPISSGQRLRSLVGSSSDEYPILDGVVETLSSNGTALLARLTLNDTLPLYERTLQEETSAALVARQRGQTGSTSGSAVQDSTNVLTSWLPHDLSLNGIPITPETLAIVTIYFVEGALGLARLAQSFLLKDELHLGPAELSALSGLFILPWTIKPLYGFLSDGFALWGYRRKSYLIVAGLLGTLSYGVLSWEGLWNGLSPQVAISGTIGALLVSSACIAFSDVVADGIVVTRTRQSVDASTAGSLQSLCWGASALGGLLSAYFSGSLLEVLSVRSIFGITAILPFLVALIAWNMPEEPVVQNDTDRKVWDDIRVQVDQLWQALSQSSIWKPALFIFLWQSTPTSDGGFFYFLTNDLHLGPEFLGRVRLLQAGAGLLGVWLYNQYFKTVKIKDILFWSTLASFPLGMLPVLLITHVNRDLGIPDGFLIMGDDVALASDSRNDCLYAYSGTGGSTLSTRRRSRALCDSHVDFQWRIGGRFGNGSPFDEIGRHYREQL